MSYWWPLLKAVPGVNTPETCMVRFAGNPKDFYDWYEGGQPSDDLQSFVGDLQTLGHDVGYPCFLRTGYTSGKHRWSTCCCVPGPSVMGRHVLALFEFSVAADIIGLPFDVWAIREFLPTQPCFRIQRFGNMPLCRERRYFVNEGRVVSHVPYWPAEAIGGKDGDEEERGAWRLRGLPDNWRELLAKANQETDDEVALLTELSERISAAIAGAWSLDWLWTARGWYAIDMAEAARSWACPPELAGSS